MQTIWDKYAESYDLLIPQTSFHQELVKKVQRHLHTSKVVLDAGTGTGIIAKALADKGKTVYGIDSSLSMLNKAQEKVHQTKGKILFSKHDVHQLYFDDAFFDGVVSVNVLYCLEHPQQFLKEIYRVLKPSGRFVLCSLKTSFDMNVLYDSALQEYREKGLDKVYADQVQTLVSCNDSIQESAFRNLYSLQTISQVLQDIGFSKITHIDGNAYLNQSFFVVATK